MAKKGRQARRGAIAVAAVTTALLVPLIVLVWWNPLNLRHGDVLVEPLAGLAVVAGAAALILAVPRRAVQISVAVLGVLLLLLVGAVAWLSAVFDDPGREVSRVQGPDGRYELVVVQVAPFVTIDPYEEVRLRSRHGPLSREVLVWTAHEDGPEVRTARFVGPRTVEVVTTHGCQYRSTFDARTLRLTPKIPDPPGTAC